MRIRRLNRLIRSFLFVKFTRKVSDLANAKIVSSNNKNKSETNQGKNRKRKQRKKVNNNTAKVQ